VSCKLITSIDFSKILLTNTSLRGYDTLLINNLYHRDPYMDLVVSNINFIQNQRKLVNLPNLKIILFTYLLPMDFLINLFVNAIIYNIDNVYISQIINVESEITPDTYLESLLKTIYLLFMNKINGLNTKINNSELKVLAFVASTADLKMAYKWLSSRLVSMINAYVAVVSNNEGKKNLSDYPSLLVLSNTTDKTVLESLKIEFDYVIDSGFVSARRLNRASQVDCIISEKIDICETVMRTHYAHNPAGKVIQLYNNDKKSPVPIDLASYVKIRQDVTDLIFCQITLGKSSWTNHKSGFMHFNYNLKCALDNLLRSKIIVKKKFIGSPEPPIHKSKLINTIQNYEVIS